MGDLTRSGLRRATSPQLCRSSWKLVPKEGVPCWHHVMRVEDRPPFGSHGAASQHQPNTNTASDHWRSFPGTAVWIISAQTMKGNEEVGLCPEKIGGAAQESSFLAARTEQGLVTTQRQRCWPQRGMLILQVGDAASEGVTRRESWCRGEVLQVASVAGCSNSIFPWSAAHQQLPAPGPSFSK